MQEESVELTAEHCRAARGLLGWNQEKLAAVADVNALTIVQFERGTTRPRQSTLAKLVTAFQSAGVELLNHGQTGVRFTQEKALVRLAKLDEQKVIKRDR